MGNVPAIKSSSTRVMMHVHFNPKGQRTTGLHGLTFLY